MISVEEALHFVQSQHPNWGNEQVLLENSIGRTLAEDILADRDFPPFDRVTMDGICINSGAFEAGKREFLIESTQLAGEAPLALQDDQNAIEIMTGAVLAKGCDVVIRYEDLDIRAEKGAQIALIHLSDIAKWQNVHRQASDMSGGSILVKRGTKVNQAIVALLATVGQSRVLVQRWPKVAIISTGDELVDVSQMPEPHQIRKSNSEMMRAELISRGIDVSIFHLADEKEEIGIKVKEILRTHDVLLLSGGVSMGKADYLPEVLAELGVEQLFHKVAQRPGKPFWFGVSPNNQQVFALPGNPISTLMCFRVYFLDWLENELGITNNAKEAVLSSDFSFKPDLGYFLQVTTSYSEEGVLLATPCPGRGSGDLANLALSNAFLYLPAGKEIFRKGEVFRLFAFDE